MCAISINSIHIYIYNDANKRLNKKVATEDEEDDAKKKIKEKFRFSYELSQKSSSSLLSAFITIEMAMCRAYQVA